jgi:hypothetical protein
MTLRWPLGSLEKVQAQLRGGPGVVGAGRAPNLVLVD